MQKVPLTLSEAVREGRCIPFVGAGVSMSVMRRDRKEPLFPSWFGLLQSCASRLEDDGKSTDATLIRALIDPGATPDYMYAAKRARIALGPVWYRLLADHFDPPAENADPNSMALPEAIWKINRKLVVTTNYDRVLHWACPSPKDLQSWEIESPSGMANIDIRRGRPTIWHLHGLISNAANLILTPDSYNHLYPSESTQPRYEAALQTLQAVLATKSLLFVGFSGTDESIAAQLKRIEAVFDGAGGPHYIIAKSEHVERIRAKALPLHILEVTDFEADQLRLLSAIASENGECATAPPIRISLGSENANVERIEHNAAEHTKRTRGMAYVARATNVVSVSEATVASFRRQLRIEASRNLSDQLSEEEFLQRIGCKVNGQLNIAGVLMFCDAPSAAAPQLLQSSMTQCVVYSGKTKASGRTREQLDGPILSQMEMARNFVAKHTPSVENPTPNSMKAEVRYMYPMVCLREIIANALCHRDYSDQSRMTYVRVFSNRIEVSSPGDWAAGISKRIDSICNQ